MVRAFLFDNGGVMTPGGHGDELSIRLGEFLGISTNEAWKLLKSPFAKYIAGKINEDELWVEIEEAYGASIETSKRAIWNTWERDMQNYPEMVELVLKLKAKGYPVGMLSNVIPKTAEEIRSNGGYDVFDFVVLSCEEDFSKPEPEFYQIVLRKLAPIKPEDVVFIDDNQHFLVPARELGMQTILAKNPGQVIEDIQSLITE